MYVPLEHITRKIRFCLQKRNERSLLVRPNHEHCFQIAYPVEQKIDKTCHLNCVLCQTGKSRFVWEKALLFLLFLPSRTSSHLQPKQKLQLENNVIHNKARFKIEQCSLLSQRTSVELAIFLQEMKSKLS